MYVLHIKGMPPWKSLTLTKNILTQLFKSNQTWKKRYVCCVQQLLPKSAVIYSKKYYSTHIIRSPYKDCGIPEVTLNEYLFNRLEKFADYPALVCSVSGRKYTFWHLQQQSKKFAVSLLKAGLKPGQVLSVVLANCPEFVVVVLGGLEAGLVVSPCNHSYTPDELSHLFCTSGAACIVTSPDKIDTVLAAKSHIDESKKIKLPLKIVVIDTKSESLPQGIGRYSELTDSHIDVSQLEALKNHKGDNRDVAIMLFSSGTTGLAKGVKLSHRNIISNIIQKDESDINNHIDASKDFQEVVPGILPFFHIIGLINIIMHSLCHGSKLITLPKFDKTQFGNFLKFYKCTIMYLVPPLAHFIGTHESVTSGHLASLHAIISGAAPLGAGDIEKCKAKLKPGQQCTFLQGYGMTETGTIAMNSFKNKINPGTVGRIVSRTEAKVTDCSTGNPIGPLEKGEICIRGPQIMIGYHNNPEATADSIDKEGWFSTGDIGYYDENGYFYVVDRVKELIKVKGFQVPPAELEEILRLHPAVDDVGVIGVPDTRCGEVPVAYIVPSIHKQASAEELKQYVANKVSPHKHLAAIVFVDSIPKTISGKILRKEMKKMYVKHTTRGSDCSHSL